MRHFGSQADTIVACATGPVAAAIAIVRLSGPRACAIGMTVAPRQKQAASHQLTRARVRAADGRVLDEALVVEMRAPRSYTGEDVVELHLHGARAVVDGVIQACRDAGARLAEPGEYTLRAFLNGRMDLTQAEAVADLIAAESEVQLEVATAHLAGGLSRAVSELLGPLEAVLARWQAALDFPEQVGDEAPSAADLALADEIGCRIQKMIDGSRTRLRAGRQVVLCGAPNVGKSSLLNAWVGERRVLVNDEPGTTRDPIEVRLSVGGVHWSVWDTAGIRDEAVGLERDGQEMAVSRIRQADLALWLVAPPDHLLPPAELGTSLVVVGGKADLVSAAERSGVAAAVRARGLEFWGWLSVRSGEGIAELRGRLENLEAPVRDGGTTIVRQRHVEALQRACGSLTALAEAKADGLALDLLAGEVEQACKALGEIVGRDVNEEVLERIFSEFCLGK